MHQGENRTPSTPRALDVALDRLWTVLHHHNGDAPPRQLLREHAVLISRAAHAGAMLPEQLVVAVKASWARHPELVSLRTRHDVLGILADVVALCITEYFRDAKVADELLTPIPEADSAGDPTPPSLH